MPVTGLLGNRDAELGNIELGGPGGVLTSTPPFTPGTVSQGLYRFVIADLNGVELDEIPAMNPQWSYVLNDAGAANIEVPLRHAKSTKSLLAVGQREIHIYRANTIVWGGHLWTADASVGDESLRLAFEGYFGRLKRRYIDVTKKYDNTEQTDIAWDLISFTQGQAGGDLGITRRSSTASGVNRDQLYPYYERTNVGDALINLSDLSNGFDFEIGSDKKWTTFYPSKGATKTVGFELGKNINGFGLTEDASNVATEYSAIGAGDGKDTCIAVATDVPARAVYGLLEMSESFTDIKRYATLQDRAASNIKMNSKPRVQPVVSLVLGDTDAYDYLVGDKVNVNVQYGWVSINKQMRIISLSFALSNEGREAVTVNFDEETTP